MLQQFAPRTTVVPTNGGALISTTILSGAPFMVWAISITELAGAAAVVTVKDNLGNNLFIFRLAANSFLMDVPFVADKGLVIEQTSGTTTCTVLHSSTTA